MGIGIGEGKDRSKRVTQQVKGGEKTMLVGDVQEYWRFYSGEGANTVWDL